MSLIFRNGRSEDVPEAARIVAHAFAGIGRSIAEWEEALGDSPYGGAETLWVGEEGDRLVAVCKLHRLEQWVGGRRIPVMGLGEVAISPMARRRGIAGRMVETGLREARGRGDVATALFPFRTSFYQKLGYGMAGEAHQYRIPPAAFGADPGRSRVQLAEEADREVIAGIYEHWAARQSGQLVRSTRAWEFVWGRGSRHGAIYRDESGVPSGYIIFRYLIDTAPSARALEIEEVVWHTREARAALYGWLGSLADQWRQIVYRAHPEEAFPEHLVELRLPSEGVPSWHSWFPSATVMRGPMFRLLDLERAWAMRSVAPGPPFVLSLEVRDVQVPENAGDWTLTFEDGRVEIRRGAAGASDAKMMVDIAGLSRLYIGDLAPSAAVMAGVATVDHDHTLHRLDHLLKIPRPWTFDSF